MVELAKACQTGAVLDFPLVSLVRCLFAASFFGLLALLPARGKCQTPEATKPARMPPRYQVSVWQDKDGLPQNSVFAITRTRDGYLWFGTAEGLVRFDGVRFRIFNTDNTPDIGNNLITCLLEDRAGALWIGTTAGGLTRYTNGRFTRFTTRDGLADDFVSALCEADDGSLWVGTYGRGLSRWKDGRFISPAVVGLPDADITALCGDRHGGLWIGTSKGLLHWQDGALARQGLPHGEEDHFVRALYCEPTGILWVGTYQGLSRVAEGTSPPPGPVEGLPAGGCEAITADRSGRLWVGNGAGRVFCGVDGRFTPCPLRDDLPTAPIRALYEDPEGDIWVGSNGGGLIRLRRGRFGVYGERDGLPGSAVRSVFEDGQGGRWVNTQDQLSQLREGTFHPCTTRDRLPPATVAALTDDHEGKLLVALAGSAGIYRDDHGTFTRVADGGETPPVSLLLDHENLLWLGMQSGLVRRSSAGAAAPPLPPGGPGRTYLVQLYEDRAGGVWIGTNHSGVYRYRDGRFTHWSRAEGLPIEHILSFHEDRAGGLWIGTHGGGLVRFKDGRFATITVKDGLYDNLAFAILEDDFGDLWMSGNKGIYRASLRELNDFADGRTRRVHSFNYDVSDGMLSRECNGGSPAAWRMHDGTLWFASLRNVVVVDPARRNDAPPQPQVEEVRVDGRELAAGASVRLHPGQEDVEIQYTALSWQRPPAIRFEYRLTGLNREWTDAGTRRTAYFSHLPPGRYRFEVRADNGDGIWSHAPASLPVVVLPPFWRTWWFLLLTGAAVVAAVGVGVYWRARAVRRQFALQQDFSRRLIEAHEGERRRIAAELHDGLGQTLAMIKNSALSGTHHARDLPAAQAHLERITEQSAHAIGEVREIAYNLRPYLLGRLGLTRALRSMLNKVASVSGLTIEAHLDDLDGLFSTEAQMSLYRIVQESLNNVLKHAHATEVKVQFTADAAAVQITVQDNGGGFAVDADGSGHGFGLLGIAERVRLLGGWHQVRSRPGQGTTLTVRVPCPQKPSHERQP